MKTLIKNVLDDMSGGQLNFESDAAREMIANTIMAVIKTDGDWFLDLSTLDGGPKLDMPIYEKTKEQKARDSWVCSICGENTADVDYDYIGSGTNHLGCELKSQEEIDNYIEDIDEQAYAQGRGSSWVDKLAEEVVSDNDTGYIYESPDGGETVYKRKEGSDKRELVKDWKTISGQSKAK